MNGHCSTCEVEKQCAYKYKPCDCANQRKFVSKEFAEYVEDMRHYFPKLPISAIRDAHKHHATPTEVRRHLERLKGQQ